MKEIDPYILYLIQIFEGYRNTPYLCPAGHRTIGYGHKIKKGEKYNILDKIQSKNLLIQDVSEIQSVLLTENWAKKIYDFRLGALISLIYNIGINKFKSYRLYEILKSKDAFKRTEDIVREWEDIVHFSNQSGIKMKLKGLVERRSIEICYFFTGAKYPELINAHSFSLVDLSKYDKDFDRKFPKAYGKPVDQIWSYPEYYIEELDVTEEGVSKNCSTDTKTEI